MIWSRRPPRWRAAIVVAIALCIAKPVAAEVQRVPLEWNAPPGCPSAAAVLADIERNLAGAGEGGAAFVAGVDVSQQPNGLWQSHLHVEARGGRAERFFEAETCQAIASAAAIIIALAAEVGGQTGDDDQPPVAAKQAECPTSQAELRWQCSSLDLMVSGLVDGGLMPKIPAAGLELAVGRSWTASIWRLRLLGSAGFTYPRSADLSSVQSVHGDFWRLSAAVRGCASTGAQFEIGLCIGGELSAMHATGPFLSGLADDTRYWFAPVASGMVSWNATSRLALVGRSDVSAPVPRRDFYQDGGLSVVYTVPAVAVGGALGLEIHFQ